MQKLVSFVFHLVLRCLHLHQRRRHVKQLIHRNTNEEGSVERIELGTVIAPQLQQRFDLAKYNNNLNKALN
jgi:hypothetical protein|tara:strand:+ start:749 stop:961 length:213 start_codon:yes stop_codon:yes gene_type:complete